MKKQFKNFALIWLAGVVLFSVIVLLVNLLSDRADSTFWVSYALIIVAYAIQMAVGYKFFNEENKDKVFLNMPLLSFSESCVIASMIIGTLLMVISPIPVWIAPIVAVIILVFYSINLVKTDSAAEAVIAVDNKVAAQTSFIKNMTVNAQNIAAGANTESSKAIANKVYEAFRYSCKTSSPSLAGIENNISSNLSSFASAVSSGNDELAQSIGGQLIKQVEERDNLAKLYK